MNRYVAIVPCFGPIFFTLIASNFGERELHRNFAVRVVPLVKNPLRRNLSTLPLAVKMLTYVLFLSLLSDVFIGTGALQLRGSKY